MSKNSIDELFKDYLDDSKEHRFVQAEEGFVLDATDALLMIIESENISRKELAKTLDMSSANVSRMLSGSRNMTLRTFAKFAEALECKIRVHLDKRSDWKKVNSYPSDSSVKVKRTGAPTLIRENLNWSSTVANDGSYRRELSVV